MKGIVKVNAYSLEEAIQIAKDEDGVIPIPEDGDFVDDSWELDIDESEIGEISDLYN